MRYWNDPQDERMLDEFEKVALESDTFKSDKHSLSFEERGFSIFDPTDQLESDDQDEDQYLKYLETIAPSVKEDV